MRTECEQSASRVRASASECERVRASARSERERVPNTLLGFTRKILLEVLLALSAALPQKLKNGRNELKTNKLALVISKFSIFRRILGPVSGKCGQLFCWPPTRLPPQAAGICKVEFVLLREQILRKSTWLHAIPVHLGHPEPAKTVCRRHHHHHQIWLNNVTVVTVIRGNDTN